MAAGGDEGAAEPERQQRVRARKDDEREAPSRRRERAAAPPAVPVPVAVPVLPARGGRRAGAVARGSPNETCSPVSSATASAAMPIGRSLAVTRNWTPSASSARPYSSLTRAGDLLHAAAPVEVRRDDEEQARHVQHLLVGAHDEVVRLGEPGALVLAEQRDARRERGRQECGVGHRRRVLRAGVEVASRLRVCVGGSGVECPPRERRPSHLPNGSASAVVRALKRRVSSG